MSRIIWRSGRQIVDAVVLEESDIRDITIWLNDYSGARFLGRSPRPVTLEEEKEWYSNLLKRKDTDIVVGVATKEGLLIGLMGLHRIDLIKRTAITGAIIGRPEYRGKGYGTEAKMMLLHYAFTELNLRKVNSTTLETNARSLAYLKKTGYKVWGVNPKEEIRGNRELDLVHLCIFKKEFMKFWRKYQRS